MFNFKNLGQLVALGGILTVAGSSFIGAKAADDDTVVTLDITAGALTMYPGDDTDNNDLCATGDSAAYDFLQDDGSTTVNVTCSAAEQTLTLTGLSVLSTRQNATATINDILFEDLTGAGDVAYSISATVSDFTSATSAITLGGNPDSLASDGDVDAPAANTGEIFATIDPTGAGSSELKDIAPVSADITNFVKGAKTSVTDTTTSIDVFNTASTPVPAGRYDLDGANFKLRVPAFVEAGSYSGTITFTVI